MLLKLCPLAFWLFGHVGDEAEVVPDVVLQGDMPGEVGLALVNCAGVPAAHQAVAPQVAHLLLLLRADD